MHLRTELKLSSAERDKLVSERITTTPYTPDFIDPSELKYPEFYKRLQDTVSKDEFRRNLIAGLKAGWLASTNSDEKAIAALEKDFMLLASELDTNGALVFGNLIQKENFSKLISGYSTILENTGSKSWIHSYVNLGNHPEFLNEKEHNGAFLHPLLVALISYRIGGPIRIVDARGKDAEPISVMAQDNMLHVDNTPYNDEYKVIVTWERGVASGPKGQNFVYIPGAHKAVRNTQVTSAGEPFSTENGSIFITESSINQVFAQQKRVLKKENPSVVEVHHDDKPLTTVFAAGSLPHHRYRTKEGKPRSCMILAFHRIKDNPGKFIGKDALAKISTGTDLNSFLFGDQASPEGFIAALTSDASLLQAKLESIRTHSDGIEVLKTEEKELNNEQFQKWMAAAIKAPTVEELKAKAHPLHLDSDIQLEQLNHLLVEMMKYDKHGPLDLRLYGDSHEEIRKWARNRIREMKLEKLEKQLNLWSVSVEQPKTEHLLSPIQLNDIAQQAVRYIDNMSATQKAEGKLDAIEKISIVDAYRSLRQLVEDLGEAGLRCENRQAFLSTSLFLFWACEELCNLDPRNRENFQGMGHALLANYFATAILIEKQIRHDMRVIPISGLSSPARLFSYNARKAEEKGPVLAPASTASLPHLSPI